MKAYIVAMLMLALIIGGCLAPGCPEVDDPVCGSDGKTYKNACFAQQAEVEEVEAGPCGQAGECSDSDGGKDIFTIGQAVDNSGTYDDECADALRVDEMFCEAGEAKVKAIPCPSGYECLTGACVEAKCSDSDGGVDEEEKGTTSAGGESETDRCTGIAAVKEYYCEKGQIYSKDLACAPGKECVEGACVESACEDSDDGKDTSLKGTTTKGAASQTDSCVDSSRVKEYFCEGEYIENQILSCQLGYECLAGKCVESICVDTDNGQDQFTKGTTSYGDESHTDSCYSSSSVIEYYCVSDTSMNYEKINCGTGHECVDGSCQVVDCAEVSVTINEPEVRHEIARYDNTDPLILYAGNVVELNDGLFLKVHYVGLTAATFKLYLDYDDFKGNDVECTVSMSEGEIENDLCGEDTEGVELSLVNDPDNYVELVLDEYYAIEYYTLHGIEIDWTDDPSCPEDSETYTSQIIEFFPYADTLSSGLDLDGREIEIFSEEADLEEIGADSIRFTLEGEEYDLEDGDNFYYRDVEYEIELTINDERLVRIEIEPE